MASLLISACNVKFYYVINSSLNIANYYTQRSWWGTQSPFLLPSIFATVYSRIIKGRASNWEYFKIHECIDAVNK